jgi:hypothetical protein
MLQKLFCGHCHAALSGEINVLPGAYPAGRVWTDYESKPLTEAGTAILSSDPMVCSEDLANRPPLQFAPQHWLNPADVAANVEDVADGHGLNGCCGPSGHGGPNQRCRHCHKDVGTLMADCWTDLVFIPQPEWTYWINT